MQHLLRCAEMFEFCQFRLFKLELDADRGLRMPHQRIYRESARRFYQTP